MNSTVKLLTRCGRGETRLLLERDQKRDQAKSKALEILPQNFVISPAQENQSGFFTRANTLVAPKMADFAPKQNAFLPSEFFLHLPSESVRTVGVRSYADAITKFSRIHRFPR